RAGREQRVGHRLGARESRRAGGRARPFPARAADPREGARAGRRAGPRVARRGRPGAAGARPLRRGAAAAGRADGVLGAARRGAVRAGADAGARCGRAAGTWARMLRPAALALALVACGGSPSAVDGRPDAPVPDAGPARHFALASAGAQMHLDTGLGLYALDLQADVDVVAVHQDFYGLPWDELTTGAPPP